MQSVLLIAFLAAGGLKADDLPAPTGDVVAEGAKLELLFIRSLPIKGGLTEGPACGPDGSIYFSDIPMGPDKGKIMRFDPRTMKTTVFAEDSFKSNGLEFDLQGHLLACEGADGGGRRVSRWNIATKKRSTVAASYMGKKFNACNDLVIDKQGRIYFSDPKYVGDEPREQKHRAVYRIDTDGTVVEVTHELSKPNGVALSPDEKTLYIVEHDNGTDKIDPTAPPPKLGPMKVYALALGDDGLVSGPKRVLIDFGTEPSADGMCVTADGNVVMAARRLSKPGVLIVTPDGKEVGFIPTGAENQKGDDPNNPPVGIPSNVEFGLGADANMLYITVDKSLYRIRLKLKGYHVQHP